MDSARRPGAAPAPDDHQRAIVELGAAASGVVIGAPGTGKTTTLVARMAHLLGPAGLHPDDVLVLTSTRQTATALRDRLALAVDQATNGPLARSVASFAFQIVRAAAVAAGDEPPQLLTGADQDRIIADLLEGDAQDAAAGRDRWPEQLGAPVRASRSFRSELRTLFAECTQLGVTPDDLEAIGEAHGHPAWAAAASFLRDYRDVVAGMRSAYRDPAEIVREAAAVLTLAPLGPAGSTVLGPPARLRVLLVDDAQELTRGGIALLEACRARGIAVLAFGDPDISSGAFRGATPELFDQLAGVLGAVHVLDAPHRSDPALTSLTRAVTAAIGAAGRVDHRRAPAPVDEGETASAVRAIVAPSPLEEVDRIARTLREWHILEGMPWNSMAVIAHDTRQVADLDAELAVREVPTRAAGVQRPLGRESVVHDLVSIVRLGLTPHDEREPEALTDALLSPYGGLNAVGLRRFRARLRHAELAAEGTRPARTLLHEAMGDPVGLALAETPEARAAERLAETLRQIHLEGERGATIHELLWLVWERSRLASSWRALAEQAGPLAAEANRSLDTLVSLFDAAKRFVERSPEEGPQPFIRDILDSDVPEDNLSAPERPDTVRLLTPAAAIGTEFDAVVIAGVQEGVWPNTRLRGGLLGTWRLADELAAWRIGANPSPSLAVLDRRRAALHDELRLLVRSLSRARHRLVVTAVDDDDLTPSPLLAFLPAPDDDDAAVLAATEHPLTLRGLVAKHRRTLTTARSAELRREAAAQLVVLADERVAGAAPSQWYGVAPLTSTAPLRDPDRAPVRVSPSRLEGFERCGLDWAIRVLGGDTRSVSSGLGTILHAAMEEVPGGDLAELQRLVDERWGELDFEAGWIGRKEHVWATTLVERMHRYLTDFAARGGRAIGAEQRFQLEVRLDGETLGEDGAPEVAAVTASDEHREGRRAILSGSIDRVEVYPSGRGADVPDDPGRPDSERVVIVDLKTGKSEDRVSAPKVIDDAQLAAYQLALLEGLIPDADRADNAGARLLVLSKTLKGTHWRVAHQEPMTAEARATFLTRIVDDALGMASDHFHAPYEQHCRDERFAVCRLHTVKAVSAS